MRIFHKIYIILYHLSPCLSLLSHKNSCSILLDNILLSVQNRAGAHSMAFSVLLSVYHKEKPDQLERALGSIYQEQTLQPDEIILVEDGPLGTDLLNVLDSFSRSCPIFRRVRLPVNQGLGNALNTGLLNCSHDLVARMDTDDISLPHRFETQVAYLHNNPDIDALGSWMAEFDANPDLPFAIKTACTKNMVLFAKRRNPMNHPTVMFRKSKVLAAGNYADSSGFEDYDLWIRMLMQGCKLANLPEILLLYRANSAMQTRRGGIAYLQSELQFLRKLWNRKFISTPELIRSVLLRTTVRLAPGFLRGFFYRHVLRAPCKPQAGKATVA